jgi:SpoVK/Ycf46/Vps4 family AAA+-type ATPase
MSSNFFSDVATRIRPVHGWDDVPSPDDVITHLRRIPAEFDQRRGAPENRERDRRSSRKGIAALFTGPSGTGKTLAAEAIASDLQLDVYRIDLGAVVSTFVGETEKNLDAIFSAAAHADAILFFDEADALFGKRSDVKDSHDRYQNLEAKYLLERIEEYPGIVILAANVRQNIDEAFIRRMRFVIEFP